jgi:hypothetical protein
VRGRLPSARLALRHPLGRPLTLPAYEPVATYPVTVRDGIVVVDVG